jgi:competence protein ComEA
MRYLSRLEIFGLSLFTFLAMYWFVSTGLGMYSEFHKDSEAIADSDTQLETPQTILVHVAGAVKNPGVYELQFGSRIGDALEKAGGYIDSSGQGLLNLAEVLEDGQKIFVPFEGEIVDYPLVTKSENPLKKADVKLTPLSPLNINTSTKEELMCLPGIGETRAMDIIEYRKKVGGFKKKSDIMNVNGIGEKIYEKIKDLIYI